jgi:hypothetical protein
MHLSKKKGHEFLLGDSAKILQFYTNITHPTQNKLAQIDWKPLGKTPTQSLEKVLERSQEKAKGDSCYFLVVDEVNILQASIRIPSDTPNFDEKLIQRAISRSVHQWSTFRFLADVPMLRKQLTDPTYRRQNKLN